MLIPIDTIELFPTLNQKLISFLKGLSPADWSRQTIARKWMIRDVAAHLLDVNYRRIALHRDGWTVKPDWPIRNFQDLVQYLNQLNADWVLATKRLSPRILLELLESTNGIVYGIFKELDPFAKAAYAVSWAGEGESMNWFDIAREYTERWLHQQQVRDAMGDKELITEELYHPFLNVFMQALPFTYRNITESTGTVLKFTVTGPGGGNWYLQRCENEWQLTGEGSTTFKSETIIDGDITWKLFSKSIRKNNINHLIEIKGDRQLGEKMLDMVSVMA